MFGTNVNTWCTKTEENHFILFCGLFYDIVSIEWYNDW
jgi:hypothetical protein